MDALRRRLLLAACLAPLAQRLGAEERPLLLGLMPVYNTRALMSSYEPLRAYLSRLLGRPVRMETAPDFAEYLRRILAGEYDLSVAAAHFARIAQKEGGWVPTVQFEPDHDTLLIVAEDRRPAAISEIAGGEVAVIDRLAITVMGALRYLEKQGLRPDVDFKVTESRTHASVAHALLSGHSRMGVTTSHGLRQLPEAMRRGLVVYRDIVDIPAFVLIAAKTLPPAMTRAIREDLLSGGRAYGAGEIAEFFTRTGYTGLHLADEAAMRRADPYLKETRRLLPGP